jgi:hypothetical protein
VRIYVDICVVDRCETWFITPKEEGSLRQFENTFLRKIFGFENEEVTEDE